MIQIDLENDTGSRQLGPFKWIQIDGMYVEDEHGQEIMWYVGNSWMTPDERTWDVCIIHGDVPAAGEEK